MERETGVNNQKSKAVIIPSNKLDSNPTYISFSIDHKHLYSSNLMNDFHILFHGPDL